MNNHLNRLNLVENHHDEVVHNQHIGYARDQHQMQNMILMKKHVYY